MTASTRPVIVWFRRELRLADHVALTEAVASGAPLLPLYVDDRTGPAPEQAGGASRWWLHGSLDALDQSLRQRGGSLIIRKGPARRVLSALIDDTQAVAVHATRSYEPYGTQCEDDVAQLCAAKDVAFHRHGGRLLFAPGDIHTKDGAPYRVFTPFWNACLARPEPRTPLGIPLFGRFATCAGEPLASLALRPTKPDWASGLRAAWTPGESSACARLSDFLDEGLDRYTVQRDQLPGAPTSMLSPHLHFGEVSPTQVWHAVRQAAKTMRGDAHRSTKIFLKEMGWRDFSYHLLHRFPQMVADPLRPEFADFPWRHDAVTLAAWQHGQTGYPVVDAAMRQLWQTGWMPNRARMIVASFLVKHLLIPWQTGAAWFWDTLVDADLANNSASWQWVSGCGTDAAPYFRIFNPVLQGEKFDPAGDYVRAFVPELDKLPSAAIHAPWKASDSVLAEAGVVLGETYPHPIVDHGLARDRALTAFKAIKRP